jgi:TRAP-type C4-dicarboxylate transport system permease large subunit
VFVLVLIALLILLTSFPSIILFLPRAFGYV